MDPEEFAHLEHLLILSISSDGEEVAAATNEIMGFMQDTEILSSLFEIITKSEEMVAVSQAAIQLNRAFSILKPDTHYLRKKIDQLIPLIFTEKYDTVSKNQILGCVCDTIRRLRTPWKKLLDVLVTINQNFSPELLRILTESLKILKDDHIKEHFQIYAEAVLLGFQTANWDVVCNAVLLLDRLLKVESTDAEREEMLGILEAPITALQEFIPAVIEEPENDAIKFFHVLEGIIRVGQVTDELITSVFEVATSDEIIPGVGVSALFALRNVVSEFDEEQLGALVVAAATHGARIIESESIQTDFLDIIEKMFDSHPHAAIFEIVKTKVQELVETGDNNYISASILIIIVFFRCATDVMNNEALNYIASVVQTAFDSENENAIRCALMLIQSSEVFYYTPAPIMFVQFIGNIVELAKSENSEVANDAYTALSNFLDNKEAHIGTTLSSVWGMAGDVKPQNQTQYLGCLQRCIQFCENPPTEQLEAVMGYIGPIIESPTDPELAAACLLIYSAVLEQDDSMAQHLDGTAAAVHECLNSQVICARTDALTFLSTIAHIMRENAEDYMEQFMEQIQEYVGNRDDPHVRSVWDSAVRLECQIIRYLGKFELLDEVIPLLQSELKTKRTSSLQDALLDLRYIVKFIDDDEVCAEFFNDCIRIATVTKLEDILSTDFLTLNKVVKFASEANQESFVSGAFQLSMQFMNGELPACSSSFADEDGSIDSNLLDDFTELTYTICKSSSEAADEICGAYMSLIERPSEAIRRCIIEVFSGALDGGSISQEAIDSFVAGLGNFIETATPNESQQDVANALNLMLKSFPDFIGQINAVKPKLIEWWKYAMEQGELLKTLTANLASLFLRIAAIQGLEETTLVQAIKIIPPADKSEAVAMCENVVAILQTDVAGSINVRKAVGEAFAKLLTEPVSSFRKYQLSDELTESVTGVLKEVCQDPAVLEAAQGAIAGASAREEKLTSILS